MALQNFVKTSQVGSTVLWTNPTDFRHVLKNSLTVSPKQPHNVSGGTKLYNAKWTLRQNLELAAPQQNAGTTTITNGTEKVSYFLEVSGSVENSVLVLEGLEAFLANARLAAEKNGKGLPFDGTFVVSNK